MIKVWLRKWLEIPDTVPAVTITAPTPIVDRYDSGPLWKELMSQRNLINTIRIVGPDTATVAELTERYQGMFENLTRRVGDLEGAGAKVAQRIHAHEQAFKLLGVGPKE